MKDIILATINARYIHASLGLRCLYANMGELQQRTQMREFTLQQRAEDIVEQLLSTSPAIIGFGVYIWNVTETTEVMRLLRIVRPGLRLVVGGPEVSHEVHEQAICALADHVITGAADRAFAELCQELQHRHVPNRLVCALPLDLDSLASPYPYYDDEDVAHRVIYVEASRGCPFKCEFCLSSLDKSAVAFDLPAFLYQMQQLIDRGARQFKFVDRTFNLKADTSRQILEFFLEQIDKELFLHFELIPDRLPDVLLDLLPHFPPDSLQFEIGIQSFNPEVQQLISRRQHHERTCHNLRWLRENTCAHVHADLIFGLPGENLQSFGNGFDLLYSLGPQEIQVGILKRLRGTPITRHTAEFDMRYMSTPPYRIVAHRDADFMTVQRVLRFARYWDLIGNSGRFPATLGKLLDASPFDRFMALSDWLYGTTTQTHRIALPRLFSLLHRYLIEVLQLPGDTVQRCLLEDFRHNGLKGLPAFARQEISATDGPSTADAPRGSAERIAQRQRRHH
ncbi:MAG: DUF4080 domain-containing protein [Granulosicoccus sp.]|nr:DUF4080 domain-containing protein [Granulosicoccus sp.]